MDLSKKKIYEIAQIIKDDWKPVYFSAQPYLDAMEQIDSINGSIGNDSGRDTIIYFLENSRQWKGQIAREVKDYLRKLIEEDK